jgi:four helix bundle protein
LRDIGKDFGLRDQIRRSAVSIPSNIAEGDERDTDKESIRFFYIAKGALAELRTQLQIAHEIGYICEDLFSSLDGRYERLAKMIGALIRARGERRGAKGLGKREKLPLASNLLPLASCLWPLSPGLWPVMINLI